MNTTPNDLRAVQQSLADARAAYEAAKSHDDGDAQIAALQKITRLRHAVVAIKRDQANHQEVAA